MTRWRCDSLCRKRPLQTAAPPRPIDGQFLRQCIPLPPPPQEEIDGNGGASLQWRQQRLCQQQAWAAASARKAAPPSKAAQRRIDQTGAKTAPPRRFVGRLLRAKSDGGDAAKAKKTMQIRGLMMRFVAAAEAYWCCCYLQRGGKRGDRQCQRRCSCGQSAPCHRCPRFFSSVSFFAPSEPTRRPSPHPTPPSRCCCCGGSDCFRWLLGEAICQPNRQHPSAPPPLEKPQPPMRSRG